MSDRVVVHQTVEVVDGPDTSPLVCVLDELADLVRQVRADELTRADHASLRRALVALVSLSRRLPVSAPAAE